MTHFVILKRSTVDGMQVAEHATLRVRDGYGRVTFGITINGRRSDLFTDRGPQRVSYDDAMADARRLFADRMRTAGHSDEQIAEWLAA